MADISSDILEIHVHGTQAVSIKQEKDFIINENVSSSKVKVTDVERSVDMFHLKLKSIPIVYTTKLDQMSTFNKIERLTSNEVAELILVESKPQYKQIPKEIKQEYGFNSPITSYIELCSNVKQLNTKAKTEAYLRNEKLLKMCKPLKIVLEDIKSNKIILSSKTLACKDLTYSTDEDATILDSSEDEAPLSKSTQRKSGSTKHFITTVAVKDKRSQEADIYVLEAVKGLISYYRTTIDELETIQTQHNSKRTMTLEYCCWANRERRINKLAGVNDLIRASLTLFLKKPHNCLPRPCRCCCINGTMAKKPSNIEFVTYSNKSVTEVSAPVRSLIQRAYKYNPRISSLTPDLKPKTDHLKCAVIIIKYHLVIFAQTELLGENYEIGNTGEISSYTKPTVNRSIAEERELYRKNDDAIQNFRIYFSFLICCWHKRQETIVQLFDSSRLSPSALRFMRTPHLCRSDKCECCCKPAPVNKLPLENITTKKNIVNTSSIKQVVKVSVNNPNIHEENMHTLFQDTGTNNKSYKPLPAQKSNKSINKSKTTQKNIKSTTKKPSSKQTVEYDSMDLATDLKINSNLTKQKPNVKQRKQIVKIPSKTNGEYTDSKTTLALINDTFNRFKDIKLAVNENGKLSAKINTPPGQLTPEDLKILSDVLLLASKHVAQLGITPQDFCNQINFSRALNGHCTLNKKAIAPTPTINSSTNDQATLKNDLRTPEVEACKATYSSMLPKTQNEALICSTFQMMSSLGGVKNQHLVRAYKLHFKEEPEQIRTLPSVARLSIIDQNKQNSVMPKIAKVKVDNATNFTRRADPPVAKRKKLVEDNTDRKKLRVKPPEELTFTNPLPDKNVQSPFSLNQSIPSAHAEFKEGTIHKPTQFYVSNTNLIPIQNISNMVLGQNTCVTAKLPVPAHNGYPMLFKMLEKDTPFHPPAHVPINPRPQARTCSVRSLIDSHKEEKRKRRIKKAEEALPPVTPVTKIDSEKNEMDVDIESSLKTTVIQMIKRGEDPIRNAINTVMSTDAVNMEPIVIVDDDDEEEGIFGV